MASQTASVASLSSASITSIPTLHEDFIPTYNQWQYQTQLARYLFDEGLLDQYDFLCFLLELIEKKRSINDLVVRVICPLILEYVIDFSRSAVLSRRLAHVCAKKLCQALHHHPMSSRSIRRNEQQQQQSNTNSATNPGLGEPNQMSRLSLNNQTSTSRYNQFDCRISDTQSSSLLRNSSSTANNNHLTANSILDIVKAQIIESQNNFVENLTIDQENSENNLYKDAIYLLSSILQVICIECPTAMVRHHIVDAKFPPMFQGSPMDHLPCPPSSLPMMESDLNFELRKSIHDAEREILRRSAMADSKWSCDSSSKLENSKGGLVNRLLTVMDLLDKHNFDKIDSNNSIDILYHKIFPSAESSNSIVKTANAQNSQPQPDVANNLAINSGILDLSSTSASFIQPPTDHGKKNKHQSQQISGTSHHQRGPDSTNDQTLSNQNYEEHVIKLLCEWATTTQRTGEHRALVVARLLEKCQIELQASLPDVTNPSTKSVLNDLKKQSNPAVNPNAAQPSSMNSKSSATNQQSEEKSADQQEEVVQFIFQNLLVQFLDENAPVIEEGSEDNIDNKKAFNNLVLLFSELIRCDVFSHYNYMCTLISRGMFNDLTKGSSSSATDTLNTDSPAPGSNLNQPGSVKPPKSISKESDSILASTIQGLGGNSNMYPLSVSTTNVNQSNHLDPLSGTKLGSSADQSLRSLGFSPVSSQQNVMQNLDKGHGLLDNHIDDVDADLGKILQDIKEGQQDEAADILLPDYMGTSTREETSNKSQQINKLSPFGLVDRSSTLDNPIQVTSSVMPPSNFSSTAGESKPPIGVSSTTEEKTARDSDEHRHMTFVKHFPVPDDDTFMHDINQRSILLYGFGKDREEFRNMMKKFNKHICKLFRPKTSRDINDGGKIKRLAAREGFNPESTLNKFEKLNHHDQHTLTNSVALTIIEMFTGVSNGQSFLLPTLEAVSFVFDLFSMASNVSGLLDLIVPVLEELPDIEAQIKLKCPIMTHQYTHSIAICIIGMLYRYHSCVLLLSKDELCSIFESLYKLVSHVQNPGACTTSAERVIFCYLHDLYSSQTNGRLFDQYSSLMQRIKLSQNVPSMSHNMTEPDWNPTFLTTIVNQLRIGEANSSYSHSSTNPILGAGSGMPPINHFGQLNANDLAANIRQQFYLHDSPNLRQMNELPAARHLFVCDAIFLSATSNTEIVNDIAVLCADVTSKCPALINDWIRALQALCCSAQRDLGYRQLLGRINISEPLVMDNIAIFTAILVARRCLQLDEFIIKCAIHAILAPLGPVDRQLTEPGVRLTCHLLLTLFREQEPPVSQSKCSQQPLLPAHNTFGQSFPNYGSSTPSYTGGILGGVPHIGGLLQTINKDADSNSKSQLNLKYLCDHYLLRSACCSIKTECHITLLKAIRVLAMWASPNNDMEPQGKVKTENTFEDVSMDGLGHIGNDLSGHENSAGSILNPDSSFNIFKINLQTASLHQFADAILRLLCSQRWLHIKCLSDSDIFTTIDTEKNILLDPRIDVKQSQRLLYMICYNKSPEKQADVGLDDQGSDQVTSIVKMFENLDVWSMRLSLMRLQFMFAYCKSQSNVMLNDWLDNLAKAVVEFFQKASQENENLEKDNDEADDGIKKTKNSRTNGSNSITDINKVWLIEPLLDKLTKPPSAVQSKIIKASAALMESASVRANSLPSLNQTYLSTAAASTKFKERTLSQRGSASTNPSNLASTSLLGFQPFLSLLLSCLKNQDKERETLLTSLNSQLYQAIHEKVDDIGYKQSLQDGLELRLCLIGQMFETIQKSPNLTADWATLLLLLIMNNLVDPQVDYGLYVSVLDMLAMLIHSAYASDPLDQKEEAKKQYQNLMKKFRKELVALEEKGFIQMKLINPLMPLVRQMTEVITCEPMGSLVDTKGEKVENFYSIDKKKGLKVSELQEVSPWDLIEGHKNPAPLSWPWFGAIRLEQKPLRADENNRLMSWHTHTVRHSTSYFCQVPNLDEGPSSAKRSNSEKKPSQSNPLLKSLIEASDESSLLSKKENESRSLANEDEAFCSDLDEHYIGRDDLLEDYCELPIDMLFDSTPIETMIEDIKTAMQAEQAAMMARNKPPIVDTKPILSSSQASSILAPIQPDPNRSTTPQVSALSALQNCLSTASSVDSSIPISQSGPASVPPPLSMSPIVNPHTPELMPARPPSNLPKITPTPPPIGVVNRSLSPMVVARSPAIVATPTPPPPKPKPVRKRKTTKKDAANIITDANANLPASMNKNTNQLNMIPSTVATYANSIDTINHAPVSLPPPMVVNQPKMVSQNPPQNQIPMHQIQQPQSTTGMIVRRGPISQAQQQQQHQQQQQQQQASVYDFPYQPQPPQSQQNNQFMNSGPMNTYYDQQAPSGNMFGQAQQPQQQSSQLQMSMQQQHHPQQTPHQMQAQQQQHMQQHQHHQIQYQQPGPQHQHQHGQAPHPQHMQPQQIRLSGHQQSMSFQQIQQHQHAQHPIFVPQQAGHSRPALTAMLHQKHAAAGSLENKMHPQPRFNNFG